MTLASFTIEHPYISSAFSLLIVVFVVIAIGIINERFLMGSLVQVAVVEHAAAGRNLEGTLLLLVGALDVLLVLHDLEHEEAEGDGAGPPARRSPCPARTRSNAGYPQRMRDGGPSAETAWPVQGR